MSCWLCQCRRGFVSFVIGISAAYSKVFKSFFAHLLIFGIRYCRISVVTMVTRFLVNIYTSFAYKNVLRTIQHVCYVWQPFAEWSMDSGCGTCTTELTSFMSSVVSRTNTSEPQSRPVVQQSMGNGSYQRAGLSVTQPAKRPLASPNAVPAACPAKPQQRQPAVPR